MTPDAALLGAGLLAIALIDLRTFRIPDWLSLPLIVAGLARTGLLDPERLPAHVLGAAAGYATLGLLGAAYFRWRGRDGLGLGDAKLFAVGGAWLGWQPLPAILAVASIGGLAFALATGLGRSARVAFGPWLALAIWLAWLIGRPWASGSGL